MAITEQDFLLKIASEPDSDSERLIYADYLEESGHALRAEFIRLQLELAQGPAGIRCKELYGWRGQRDDNDPASYTYYQGEAIIEPTEMAKVKELSTAQKIDVCCWTRLGRVDSRPFWCVTSGRISSMTARNNSLVLHIYEAPPISRWKPDLYEREWKLLNNRSPDLWDLVPWAKDRNWTMTTDMSRLRLRVGKQEGKQDIWCHIRKGFIEEIHCRAEDWQQHGPDIIEVCPIKRVEFTDVRPTTTNREPGFNDFYCWVATWINPLHYLTEDLKFGHGSWRDTEQECLDDASRAALQWARIELVRRVNGRH